jgi:hypothetical protein
LSSKTSIEITSPEKLEAFVETVDPTTDSTADGEATALIYGGIPPYSMEWSSSETTEHITGLAFLSSDTITVTDHNGCIAKNKAAIGAPHNTCFIGSPIVSTTCGPYSYTGCGGCSSVTKDIKLHFGAVGDGVTDDQCAFEAASAYFASVGQNVNKRLLIPPGTYLVGNQEFPWLAVGSVLYFNDQNNITIFGIPDVQISGFPHYTVTFVNPVIKFKNCMLYGAFSNFSPPVRLESCNQFPACASPGWLYCNVAVPGDIIHLNNCENVRIFNLELDGNIDNAIIGGGWTQEMQLPYDGFFFNVCRNVNLNNVSAHHFGQDGMRIYYNKMSHFIRCT